MARSLQHVSPDCFFLLPAIAPTPFTMGCERINYFMWIKDQGLGGMP